MSFVRDYPALSNFLACWCSDADLEGRTDEEAAREFAASASREDLDAVLDEAHRLFAAGSFPFAEVGRESNRFFEDVRTATDWLAGIIGILEDQGSEG